METIEHFAKISLVARMLGRENLLSRDEVDRLQGLRGMYGIASPAPICADETLAPSADGQVECQVVQAPAIGGARLVRRHSRTAVRRRRQRRGNSANIPRTDGADRGRRQG